MAITRSQSQKLKRFIRELEQVRGRHTELVTVYVPAGYDLNKIIGHLADEQGTATNIKDARTRKNVIDSLEKAIRHLRLFKRTPENGLAIFSGNASENESKIDIKVWSIEPPEPLNLRLYRCDQSFVLDALREMMETKEQFGLIVLDRKEATLGLLRGTNIKVLTHMNSAVPGKTRAGGQSAQRFARIREGAMKEFFKRIAEAANKDFLNIKTELKGILIGGPSPTKERFMDFDYLNQELKAKIISIQDLTYTDESGLHHLVDKSRDVLAKEEIMEEKQLMQKFLEFLAKEPEKVSYGLDQVKKALEFGAVDTLLLSEDLDDKTLEELEDKAEQLKTKVKIISTETREGVQLKDMGKVAAILRYAFQ